MAWDTAGIVTDPAAAAILADTGALSLGLFDFTIIVYVNTAGRIELVHRNALNNADVKKQIIYSLGTSEPIIFHFSQALALSERIVVRCRDGFTGDAQASIMH